MKGKDKCKALKEIRAQIAEKNDIQYAVSECTHKGDCKGTCPKCEAEVAYLERELERKKKLGANIAIAGISAALFAGLTGCGPADGGSWSNGGSVATKPSKVNTENATVCSTEETELEGETEYDPNNYDGSETYIDPTTEEFQLDGDVTAPEPETETTEEIFELDGAVAAPIED